MACAECQASLTCGGGADDVVAYCPRCWDEWVEGARVLRDAECMGCRRWATCLGARGWGGDATARGWYLGDYCWGCWMDWAVSDGRWSVVQGAAGGRPRLRAEAAATLDAAGEGDGEASQSTESARQAAGTAEAGEGDAATTEEGAGGVVDWREVERDCWASGNPPVFFYSWGTGATWLSSMSMDYGFWGIGPPDKGVAGVLRGRQLQRFFRSRETWFCYVKCIFAAEGADGQRSLELADEMLRMPPKQAKRAGQAAGKGGRLSGLDVAAWDQVKVQVMAEGAWMQAKGNAEFRGRLLRTSDALLLEASATDGFWGIGMDVPTATRVPQGARRSTFGTNWHGAALMMARERIRREEGHGGEWRAHWQGLGELAGGSGTSGR